MFVLLISLVRHHKVHTISQYSFSYITNRRPPSTQKTDRHEIQVPRHSERPTVQSPKIVARTTVSQS